MPAPTTRPWSGAAILRISTTAQDNGDGPPSMALPALTGLFGIVCAEVPAVADRAKVLRPLQGLGARRVRKTFAQPERAGRQRHEFSRARQCRQAHTFADPKGILRCSVSTDSTLVCRHGSVAWCRVKAQEVEGQTDQRLWLFDQWLSALQASPDSAPVRNQAPRAGVLPAGNRRYSDHLVY
jgi:hypothetical protein